jgi:ribose 5-phosphate isomerase B
MISALKPDFFRAQDEIVQGQEKMKLVIAADHAGFELKEKIRAHLQGQKYALEDCGAYSADPANWAEYGARAAAKVSADPENTVGILICGSGIGMSIVANKFKAVRAALCRDETDASTARSHNNANVLALGARVTEEAKALRIVDVFLRTPFEGGRHQLRLDYLSQDVENKIIKNNP